MFLQWPTIGYKACAKADRYAVIIIEVDHAPIKVGRQPDNIL